MKTILGIDPGSRITGYGLIRSNGFQYRYVDSGCIRVVAKETSSRLQEIFDGVRELIFKYQPEHVAIEQVFVHRNVSSALKLGQARGVAMVVPALHAIPVSEYSARQVKLAVVGYGAADKNQVSHMVKHLLALQGTPQTDASDALAIALCHAMASNSLNKKNLHRQILQ
jgi:crossover junction endodeoxyribonuclease RuvC